MQARDQIDPALRAVVQRLAPIERSPGSQGEAAAADWLVEQLRQAGCEAEVERARFHDGFAQPIGTLTAAATLGGLIAARRHGRALGALIAAVACALIVDDVSNGPRVYRRLQRTRPTQNVVALAGEKTAQRTLVVLAHHDAAPTGLVFNDRLQVALGERFPGLLERIDTSLPLWWLVLAGPATIILGAARRSDGLIRVGTAAAALSTAAMADIARSPTVPGANDNLSSVAVQVGLARRLQATPLKGLRVMLVSCGAEEVIQGGIYSFAERHFAELDRGQTWFLCLDTVGSPILALLEGEGPVVMEDYPDVRFRDLIAQVAAELHLPLRRGMRSRNSTDAVIPSHAGYPTATLVSFDRHKALSNYHRMSDTPENVDYGTVARALELTEAVARRLAERPGL
ncbi:MAG: M28 family metallopeptidase [Solirubrobacteraceae bacterium]